MADDNVRKQAPAHEHRQDNVGQFATRLGCMASSTAEALYAIVHMKLSPSEAQSLENLAQRMYALTAVLSSLRAELIETGEQDVWTEEHDETLLSSMRECERVFRNIITAIRKADELLKALPRCRSTTESVYAKAFNLKEQPKALSVVEKCFKLAIESNLVVRHEFLCRKERLEEDEVPEASRLILAFNNLALRKLSRFGTAPFGSEIIRELSLPQGSASSSPDNRATFRKESDASAVSSNTKDSNAGDLSTIGVPNEWLSFDNPQYPAGRAAISEGPEETDGQPCEASSLATYASTSKGQSEPGQSTVQPFVPSSISKGKAGTISFGEASIIKPASAGSPFSVNVARACPFANYSQSTANPFTPTPHLEAYMLRPMVQSTDSKSTMFYEIESLRLSEATMQAQVRSLGSDYSVMKTLLDLEPQQLHLIQLRAIQRQGSIVSVEHGKSISLTTVMGSLPVRPAVFVISTTTMLPRSPASFQSLLPASTSTPDPVKSSDGRIFNGVTDTSGFGSCSADASASTNHHLSSPEAYSAFLHEQGESCTYVEGSVCNNHLQHYQTITMNKGWHDKDRSLEEIRVADYKADRTGPMKANGTYYPWDAVKMPLGQLEKSISAEPPQPADVKASKTALFPTTRLPSAPGPTFRSSNPNPGHLPSDAAVSFKASMSNNFVTSRVVPPTPSPFDRIAPDLPPFVPPQQFANRASNNGWASFKSSGFGRNSGSASNTQRVGPNTSSGKLPAHPFGSLASGNVENSKSAFRSSTTEDGFCPFKHQHGPFCRTPAANKLFSNGTHRSLEDNSVTSAHEGSGCMLCQFDGRVCRCYDQPSSTTSVPGPFSSSSKEPLFGAAPRANPFGNKTMTTTSPSPFATLANNQNKSLFAASAPQQPACYYFAKPSITKSSPPGPKNLFGAPAQQSSGLFGNPSATVPANPPSTGGLFQGFGTSAAQSLKKNDSLPGEQ